MCGIVKLQLSGTIINTWLQYSLLLLVNLHHAIYFYFTWLHSFLTASRLFFFDISHNILLKELCFPHFGKTSTHYKVINCVGGCKFYPLQCNKMLTCSSNPISTVICCFLFICTCVNIKFCMVHLNCQYKPLSIALICRIFSITVYPIGLCIKSY